MSLIYTTLPTMEYRDVKRGYYGTTLNSHVTSSNIIRVTQSYQSYLTSSLPANPISYDIPISNANLFGTSGLILINSEFIGYNSGYGISVIGRGSLNTIASSHSVGTSYYQYSLGNSTQIRTSISTGVVNIPIYNNTGLTSNPLSLFLITASFVASNPEVVSGGTWNKSLDVIDYNLYISTDQPFSINSKIYSIASLASTNSTTLSDNVDSQTLYIPLTDG
jgi:hypothetical protein